MKTSETRQYFNRSTRRFIQLHPLGDGRVCVYDSAGWTGAIQDLATAERNLLAQGYTLDRVFETAD